jgi:hypothetical protein
MSTTEIVVLAVLGLAVVALGARLFSGAAPTPAPSQPRPAPATQADYGLFTAAHARGLREADQEAIDRAARVVRDQALAALMPTAPAAPNDPSRPAQ